VSDNDDISIFSFSMCDSTLRLRAFEAAHLACVHQLPCAIEARLRALAHRL